MQFVFGNNRSRYGLLYTDGNESEANKLLDLITLPFSPDAQYDTYGFFPFGTNRHQQLFFRCKKDSALSRGVYYLHGVTFSLEEETYKTDLFERGLFHRYMEQDVFEEVREGKDGFSFPIETDPSLINVDEEALGIPSDVVLAIAEEMYKRNKATIVIDDDKYSDALVFHLLKKIYSLLTPTLRSMCTYVVALADTGDMDFMLRILPKSMWRGGTDVCFDLYNYQSEDKSSANSFIKNLYSHILRADENTRETTFKYYEYMYYGWLTAYRKQALEELLVALTKQDAESCEKVVDSYLTNDKYSGAPVLEFFSDKVTPLFRAEGSLDAAVDGSLFDPLDPLAFYEEYELLAKKIFIFADPTISYFKKIIENGFDVILTEDKCASLLSSIEALKGATADADEVKRAYITHLLPSVEECVKRIAEFKRSKDTLCEQIRGVFAKLLNNNYSREVIEAAVERLKAQLPKNIDQFIESHKFDFSNAFSEVLTKCYREAIAEMNLREEELRRNAELNKEAIFERKLNESSKKLLKYEKYIYSTFRDGDSLSVLYTGETTPFSAFDYANMLSLITSLTPAQIADEVLGRETVVEETPAKAPEVAATVAADDFGPGIVEDEELIVGKKKKDKASKKDKSKGDSSLSEVTEVINTMLFTYRRELTSLLEECDGKFQDQLSDLIARYFLIALESDSGYLEIWEHDGVLCMATDCGSELVYKVAKKVVCFNSDIPLRFLLQFSPTLKDAIVNIANMIVATPSIYDNSSLGFILKFGKNEWSPVISGIKKRIKKGEVLEDLSEVPDILAELPRDSKRIAKYLDELCDSIKGALK